MNSPGILQAIERVRARVEAMSAPDLRREFDAFQPTSFYGLLLHSGHFEANEREGIGVCIAKMNITASVPGSYAPVHGPLPTAFSEERITLENMVYRAGGCEQWAA